MLRAVAVLFCLLAVMPAHAADDAGSYAALVAAAKRGNPVDWQALRYAYADSPDFDVLGTATATTRKKMLELFQAGDFAGALQQATQLLDRVYVDIDGHSIAERSCQKLGNAPRAKMFHDSLTGLLDSIRTGDGQTPATAFTVISVGEEYALLRALGLRSLKQHMINADGHFYDRLDTLDPDGKLASLYFRIDRVLAAEAAAMKKRQ
jgi:hypothetical protein